MEEEKYKEYSDRGHGTMKHEIQTNDFLPIRLNINSLQNFLFQVIYDGVCRFYLTPYFPPSIVGYDRNGLRRSRNRNRIFYYLIPVLLTGTGIYYDNSGSGRTGTGIF